MLTSFKRWIGGWPAVALIVTLYYVGGVGPGSYRLVQAFDPPGEKASKSALDGLQIQPLDEPLKRLEPRTPRTAEEQQRLDAVAHYMAGQLKESQNDRQGALDEYRKAIALDPKAVEVYHALVPLAFSLNRTQEAVDFALKAIELDPNDYQLLRRLGVHMASQRNLAEAVQLLEKATQSESIEKHSAVFVSLQRDLVILYSAVGDKEKAADAYAILFEALESPETFNLDFRTRAALLADPVTAYEKIGEAFLAVKRMDLAVKAFERAETSGKGSPGQLSYNLAQVYFLTEQFDKALAEIQKYYDAQLQSKGRDAYQLLADILTKTEKSDELVHRLEAIAEKDPHNAPLQIFLAGQYVAGEQLDKAEQLYKTTLKESAAAEAYVGLAGIYRRQGRAEELLDVLVKAAQGGALEQLESEFTAIGQEEKLVDSLITVGQKQLEGDEPKLDFAGRLILAKLSAAANKTAAVVQFYRSALEARRDQAALIYEELGGHLLAVDDYAEAAKVFREAADTGALAQAKPTFLFRLSQALEMGGETNAALEAVAEARKLVPEHPLLHYQEGWVHLHSRHWDDAIRVFEEVLTKYPQQEEIVRRCQFSLSNLYVQKGDIKKGEEILEKILEADPDDTSVNNDLGYLYADQGKNLEQAEKMIRKALDAEPDNPAYLDSMGWVLFKLGRFEEALGHLEKAVALPSGSDATILDHLGDCYDRLAKPDKARETWQKALEHAEKQPQPDAKLIEGLKTKLKTSETPGDSAPKPTDTP